MKTLLDLIKNTKNILILVLFVGCSDITDQTIEYRIDPLLIEYVDQFYVEAEMRNQVYYKNNLIVSIVDNLNNAGEFRQQAQQNVILIKRSVIQHFIDTRENPKYAIESLVFHEMGHAILNRRHSKNYSLMSEGLSFYEYENDSIKRRFLIDELFEVSYSKINSTSSIFR